MFTAPRMLFCFSTRRDMVLHCPQEHLQPLPTAHGIIPGALLVLLKLSVEPQLLPEMVHREFPDLEISQIHRCQKTRHGFLSSKNFPIACKILRWKMNLLIILDYKYISLSCLGRSLYPPIVTASLYLTS